MRRTLMILAIAAAPLGAQQQQAALPANAGMASARSVWMIPHGFVAKALEQTP